MTKVKGLRFEEAFGSATLVNVDDVQIRLLQYEHLWEVKKQAGRAKDLENL